MTTPAERLRTWAREAIAEYDAQVKEGEPPFPQSAYDVLEVLDELESGEK